MSNVNDFVVSENGVLIKYVGKDEKVVIPPNVIEIGMNCFQNNTDIKEVIIPNTVEEIGFSAFEDCTNLKFVSLPTFYTKIRMEAFLGCTALISVDTTEIGDELDLVVSRTEKLKNALKEQYPELFTEENKLIIRIPNKITSQTTKNDPNSNDTQNEGVSKDSSSSSSANSTSVTTVESQEVVISEKLREILDKRDKLYGDSYNGSKTNNDMDVYIGETDDIDWIRKLAKMYDVGLFPKPVVMRILTVEDLQYVDVGIGAFFGCENLVNINLPNLTTSINMFAFYECSKLKIVQGKSRLIDLYDFAFENCVALEYIRMDNKANIHISAFAGCSMLDRNGNLISYEIVDEYLDLESISVYVSDKGPSTINGLKFEGKKIMPITQVIQALKENTLKSYDVSLNGETLCIDDKIYRSLSRNFSVENSKKALFFYEDVGVGSNKKIMQACKSFRSAYKWYKENNIAIVPLKYVDGCEVTSMYNLMSGIDSGEDIDVLDLTHFDTEKVTDMNQMFAGLNDVKEIIFGKSFKTLNVISMCGMFKDCSKLENLSVAGFDTKKVIDMSYMFSCCRSLEEVNISSWDMSKVVNTSYMFNECYSMRDFSFDGMDLLNVRSQRNWLPKNPVKTQTVGLSLRQILDMQTENVDYIVETGSNLVVTLT